MGRTWRRAPEAKLLGQNAFSQVINSLTPLRPLLLTRRRGGAVSVAFLKPDWGQRCIRPATSGAACAPTPPKHDPRSKYPKPPFPEQTQPWPGLAGEMNPKPDHGEISYRGSGRLAGRKALITGGDSGIGRAAAIAYAREGADVAINYFPTEEPDAREVIQHIKEAGMHGVSIPGDLRDRAFCQRLVTEAAQKLEASTSSSATPACSIRGPRSSSSATRILTPP